MCNVDLIRPCCVVDLNFFMSCSIQFVLHIVCFIALVNCLLNVFGALCCGVTDTNVMSGDNVCWCVVFGTQVGVSMCV